MREREAVRADDPRSTRTIVVTPHRDASRHQRLVTLYAHPREVESSTSDTTRMFT